MHARKFALLAGVCALTLSGCNSNSVKEQAVSAKLPPMEQPARPIGYTRQLARNGEPYTSRLSEDAGGVQRWEQSNGCRYATQGLFAPSVLWKDCGSFSDGEQTLTASGSPWPLAVGNSWSYDFQGENMDGNTWSGTRNCQVESTARISTSAGEHDTYKVVCDSEFSRRTFYVSPTLGDFVRLERWRKSSGETDVIEVKGTS